MVEIRFFLQDQELEPQSHSESTSTSPLSYPLSVPLQYRHDIPIPHTTPAHLLGLDFIRLFGNHHRVLSGRSPRSSSKSRRSRVFSFFDRLRIRLYRHCPVGLLPPELLSLILEIAFEDGRSSSRVALTLTQVCVFWRAVALSTSALWTTVDFDRSVDGGAEFLRRSKDKMIDLILPELPVPADAGENAAIPLQSQLFNRARSVSWYAKAPFTAALNFGDDFEYISNIRHLDLKGIALSPWGRFTNLTDLTLRDLPRAICPTSDELLALFKDSFNIRNVCFMNLDPEISPPVRRSRYRDEIPLPHLECCAFVGPVARALLCSRNGRIMIPTDAPLWTARRTCCAHHISKSSKRSTPQLRVLPGRIILEVDGTIVVYTSYDPEHIIAMVLPLHPLLTSITSVLDLTSIKRLHCEEHWLVYDIPLLGAWDLLLRGMNALEEVSIVMGPVNLSSFLTLLWPTDSPSPGRERYFPTLRSLELTLPKALRFSYALSRKMSMATVGHLQHRKEWISEPLEQLTINFGDDTAHRKLRELVKVLNVVKERCGLRTSMDSPVGYE